MSILMPIGSKPGGEAKAGEKTSEDSHSHTYLETSTVRVILAEMIQSNIIGVKNEWT